MNILGFNETMDEFYDEGMQLSLYASVSHNDGYLEIKREQFKLKWRYRLAKLIEAMYNNNNDSRKWEIFLQKLPDRELVRIKSLYDNIMNSGDIYAH